MYRELTLDARKEYSYFSILCTRVVSYVTPTSTRNHSPYVSTNSFTSSSHTIPRSISSNDLDLDLMDALGSLRYRLGLVCVLAGASAFISTKVVIVKIDAIISICNNLHV